MENYNVPRVFSFFLSLFIIFHVLIIFWNWFIFASSGGIDEKWKKMKNDKKKHDKKKHD